MVEYCPRCNAQLPPGLEKCPRCGKRLRSKNGEEYTARDIFWLSISTLGIVLIPMLIIIGIAALCIYLTK